MQQDRAAKRVVVVGAGPAGMMAAATAASRGHCVTLLEKNPMAGKKLLITGKGRCNVTTACDRELYVYLLHIAQKPEISVCRLCRL